MMEALSEVREGYSPKQIKMAIGIASDKRYAGGNMSGAVTAIEKIKKGLSDHKQVAAVLKRQNEDTEPQESVQEVSEMPQESVTGQESIEEAINFDAASKSQLERGARMVELLKQGQYSPFSVERQVASIWAGTTGNMDSIAVPDIRRFESEFLDFIARERKQIFEVISTTRELSDDTVAALTEAITAFKTQFKSSVAAVVNEKKADALSGEDNEQITRQVPAKK